MANYLRISYTNNNDNENENLAIVSTMLDSISFRLLLYTIDEGGVGWTAKKSDLTHTYFPLGLEGLGIFEHFGQRPRVFEVHGSMIFKFMCGGETSPGYSLLTMLFQIKSAS